MMTEHVHEWYKIRTDGLVAEVVCIDGCTASVTEILQKASATERVSAKTARNILESYKTGRINIYFAMSTIRSALKAYADILEGK